MRVPHSPAPVSDQRWDAIPGHSQRCDRKRSGDVGVFLPESASSSPRDGTELGTVGLQTGHTSHVMSVTPPHPSSISSHSPLCFPMAFCGSPSSQIPSG